MPSLPLDELEVWLGEEVDDDEPPPPLELEPPEPDPDEPIAPPEDGARLEGGVGAGATPGAPVPIGEGAG